MSWGRNAELQLGDGRSTILRNPTRPPGPRATPEPVQRSCGPEACEPLSELKSIAAGGYHNLAVKSDGTVWAWGSHDCGQLGNGKLPTSGFTLTAPSSVPTQVLALNGGVAVAAGRAHSLALDNRGMLWGWGDNSWGQVGNGARPIGESGRCVIAPTKVALPTRVVAFAAGSDHSLALTEDGTVWSWGVNCSGQLGSLLDKESHRYAPAPVIGGWGDQDPVVSLAAGGEYGIGHSLALTQNGQVWAWGLAGVLGSAGGGDVPSPCKDNPAFMPREGFLSPRSPDLEQRARPTPRQVSGLSGAVFIEAGAFHSVVINEEGELFTWGRNDQGQLGQPPG
ncbi:MAG TPA: hypothetical protein VEI97_19260, partial [bacterium]|nr:hypothetical protein [bacterium]